LAIKNNGRKTSENKNMIKTINHNKLAWYHIDKLDDESILFLENNFHFHTLDIKDIRSEAEESKIDIYKNYLFLIIQFPTLHRMTGQIGYMELDVFLGKDFLVTIQKEKNKSMRDFYYHAQNNHGFRKACFLYGPGYLLYRILQKLYRDTRSITNYVSKKAIALEDMVYGDAIDENTAREIAYLRKKILSLERIFEPERKVFGTLSKLNAEFAHADLNVYFDDIDDYVGKVWNFLDNQKHSMKDLLEVHDSLLTHATNKVIKILAVISVAIMPLTLLSGIYGMNIDLPFSGSPSMVWFVFFMLLILIAATVFFFKRKKWM